MSVRFRNRRIFRSSSACLLARPPADQEASGFVMFGGEFRDALPPAPADSPPPDYEVLAALDDQITRDLPKLPEIFAGPQDHPQIGSPAGGGGIAAGGGDFTDYKLRNRRNWALVREVAYNTRTGERLSESSAGYEGYTMRVFENPEYLEHPAAGYEDKITGHKGGHLHRHGYMSDDTSRGRKSEDYIRSNLPHWGLLGDVIGKPKP